MRTPLIPASRRRGLTLIEVLVVLVLVALLVVLFFPFSPHTVRDFRTSRQVRDSMNICTSMVIYAGDGEYPLYRDKKDLSTKITSSSEAFEILLQGGYLDDKKLLFQNGSAWCRKTANTKATAKQVLPGENDWCYVAGLNRSTAKGDWPILANAFAPGTTHYVSDIGKKGGEWKGVRAVVIYCDGHAEIVHTLDTGGGNFIVRRPGQSKEDAFVPSGGWLAGPELKVLYPKGD